MADSGGHISAPVSSINDLENPTSTVTWTGEQLRSSELGGHGNNARMAVAGPPIARPSDVSD